MKLLEMFKKQGGLGLLKQYWKQGALWTAMVQFLTLGKSRTALEILRLSTQLKTKQKLKKKYMKTLEAFAENVGEDLHEVGDKVWVCWFQGLDNAPELVKKCYESLKKHFKGREVVLITSDNMSEYVEMPSFILEKWKKGIITNTHMTDLLRLELLIKHGGIWIDATVFCTSDEIPSYILESDLFMYQTLKPGRDGQSMYMSSWLISAKTNNRILKATRHLCYEYWKRNNKLVDYFLLHQFMSIVFEYYSDDWYKIVPCDNSTPHILLLRLFDAYDECVWESVKQKTCFHKLSYKFDDEQAALKDTFYDVILNGDAN